MHRKLDTNHTDSSRRNLTIHMKHTSSSHICTHLHIFTYPHLHNLVLNWMQSVYRTVGNYFQCITSSKTDTHYPEIVFAFKWKIRSKVHCLRRVWVALSEVKRSVAKRTEKKCGRRKTNQHEDSELQSCMYSYINFIDWARRRDTRHERWWWCWWR